MLRQIRKPVVWTMWLLPHKDGSPLVRRASSGHLVDATVAISLAAKCDGNDPTHGDVVSGLGPVVRVFTTTPNNVAVGRGRLATTQTVRGARKRTASPSDQAGRTRAARRAVQAETFIVLNPSRLMM